MEVTARAPGKIILAGEHAVVHGSTAVAASIDLYTYVSLSCPADSGTYIALHSFHSFPVIGFIIRLMSLILYFDVELNMMVQFVIFSFI